jgi:hypothetical protein
MWFNCDLILVVMYFNRDFNFNLFVIFINCCLNCSFDSCHLKCKILILKSPKTMNKQSIGDFLNQGF